MYRSTKNNEDSSRNCLILNLQSRINSHEHTKRTTRS